MCNNNMKARLEKNDSIKIDRFAQVSTTDEPNESSSTRPAMGWFQTITLKIDEYCCMSYAAQQVLLEANDSICSKMFFSQGGGRGGGVDEYHSCHKNNSFLDNDGESKIGCKYGFCGRDFNTSNDIKKHRGVMLPLHIVKEDGGLLYSKCHIEEISPNNCETRKAGNVGKQFDFHRTEEQDLEERTYWLEQRNIYRNSLFDALPYEERQGSRYCDI